MTLKKPFTLNYITIYMEPLLFDAVQQSNGLWLPMKWYFMHKIYDIQENETKFNVKITVDYIICTVNLMREISIACSPVEFDNQRFDRFFRRVP